MKPEVISNRRDSEEQKYKQSVADALHHAVYLLQEEGVISRSVSNVISAASKEIGSEIFRRIKDIARDIELVEDEELMLHMDSDIEEDFQEVSEPLQPCVPEPGFPKSPSSSSSGSEEEDPNSKDVPWKTKLRVVAMSKQHPKWSVETIRSKTTRFLTSRDQLKRWKRAVERRGSSVEKTNIINDWTWKRFVGARSRKRLVTTRMLQQWATERAKEFVSEGFRFEADRFWVDKFKRDRNIRQRSIIRFVNKADPPMLEVMLP